MKIIHRRRQLLMLLLIAVFLIPVLVTTVYASPKVWYEFHFSNGAYNAVYGKKTDYSYSAGVSVWEGSEFNNGNVRFQLFDPTGTPYSYESARVYGVNPSCPVYYFDYLTFNGDVDVFMEGHGYNGMISCKGNFVP